jgi:hypothetical protein
MALQTQHPLTDVVLQCQTPSVGATPQTAIVRVPFRCKILQLSSVLGGAITTADATVTCSVNTTAITGGTITITQSGSALGQINTANPTALTVANEGDYIKFVPSGASGASIQCNFDALVRRF